MALQDFVIRYPEAIPVTLMLLLNVRLLLHFEAIDKKTLQYCKFVN